MRVSVVIGKLRLPEHLSNAIVQQSFQLANVDCHILTHPTLKSPFITSIFMRSRRIFSDLSFSTANMDVTDLQGGGKKDVLPKAR